MGGLDKFKAYENVFDQSTLRSLFKLSSQNYFDELKSLISLGKEANVFSATKDDGYVAVKIYRVSANFKKMYEYMSPDPRFAGLKRNKTSIIYSWAKKEYRNLLKCRKVGIKVPKPIAVYKNILVMEFIGKNNDPAPLMSQCPPEDPKIFYERLIKDVQMLYREARLVHGDLSAFNVINYEERPIIIDWSHAVDLRYPNVKELLKRDIKNVCMRFKKQGFILDPEKEFERVIK
ncbi:MAG: serine protein kinase RIO [archaeon]